MALDPRLLQSFVVLAEDLHFGRAAERLHIAQSGLSAQIRRLEQQVGVQLYTRNSRVVELTDAGRAMLEPARAALRATAHAERAAKEANRLAVHQLSVGLEAELEDLVPNLLAYAAGNSEISLWLSRMHEPQGHEVLASSQIDAFIGFLPPAAGSHISQVRSIDVALSALVHPDHPLARRSSVSLRLFRQSPIAIFGRDQSPRRFDRLVEALSEGEGRESLSLRELAPTGTASQGAMLADVNAGDAVGFGTSWTVAAAGHLRSLPFDPPLCVPTYISWRAEQSMVVDALVDHLSRESEPEPG